MSSINLLTTIFAFICATTLHGQIVSSQYNGITAHKRHTQLCTIDPNNNRSSNGIASATSTITEGICDCEYENDGNRFGVICTRKQFDAKSFVADQIPENTEILHLNWNEFETVPQIHSNKLSLLDLSNNRIETIPAQIFNQLTVLIELDLSHNHINAIESSAFNPLTSLKRLDLSYNHLYQLNMDQFKPLISLEALILSKNLALNQTLGKLDVGLFTTLGVTPKLTMLELNDLNLRTLNLENGTELKEIYLRYNHFQTVPATLPAKVELLDFSGNRFIEIDQHFLPFENALRELHLSQMLTLKSIKSNAFHNLTRLQTLNLDGCRNLERIYPDAFNRLTAINNGSHFAAPFLDRINLRNAKLQIFNLGNEAAQLQWERINLHGNPLICDCLLKWIRQLPIDTYARCAQPAELNDHLVTSVPKSKFVCRFWPNFVYILLHSAMLLCILFIAAVPIWLLVVMLKPSRRVKLQKIGSSSPYAPITIHTNRAEDYY